MKINYVQCPHCPKKVKYLDSHMRTCHPSQSLNTRIIDDTTMISCIKILKLMSANIENPGRAASYKFVIDDIMKELTKV